MRPDHPPVRPPHVPAATWGATTALVLLLGGLGLFLMGCDVAFRLSRPPQCPPGEIDLDPTAGLLCEKRVANHYACECQCTKGFSIGARVAAAEQTRIRATPAGSGIGTASTGLEGIMVGGPVQAVIAGQDETWVQVDFATGADGWVLQREMAAIDTDALVVKAFDACLPPILNANLPGGSEPSLTQVAGDCSARVAAGFGTSTQQDRPPGSTCTCDAQDLPSTWDASCDAGCTDPTGVCLLAGSDPPQPTPDPLSTTVFGTSSVCEVTGEAEIHIDDRLARTGARGIVQIHGRPCLPGQTCQVGLSYQLTFDNFSIPVRFASDPNFVDLSLSGASEPLALELGPLLGPLHVGSLPPGTTLNSARGRRGGQPDHVVLVGRHSGPLDVAVDWVNKHCLIDGDFVGTIIGDDDETTEVRLVVTAGGLDDTLSRLVNQPPRAAAGADQTVECTAPEGTPVTLSAAGSTDAEGNIAFHVWRRGGETGPLVAAPSTSPTLTTAQTRGATTYVLRVVDDRLAADTDSVTVSVVDTGAPTIDCQAPARIGKHAAPVTFRATAADSCGPASAVVIANVECLKVLPNGRTMGNPSCRVVVQADTLTIDRTGGVDLIRWSARATDAVGNAGQKTCEVLVDK